MSLQKFLPLLRVLAGLGIAAWLIYEWGLPGFILSIALGLCLSRLPAAQRHAQWPLPILALLASLACAVFFWRLRDGYLSFLHEHAADLKWLSHAGMTIPQDIGGFLPIGNMLFLLLYALLKIVFVLIRGLLPTDQGVPLGIAYEQDFGPLRQWRLKPGWLAIRWSAFCAAALGFASLLAAWYTQTGELDAAWIPLLPAGVFIVGLETAFWLGGLLPEKWRPEFDGGKVASLDQGDFDALWRRYLANWQDSWLAAGNRLPGGKD